MESIERSSDAPEPLSGKFKESFAYTTIKDRLPVILTKVIDSIYRDRHSMVTTYGLESTEEIKKIIGRLSELRNEMLTNKPITCLKADGSDIHLWNNYLEYQQELYGFEPAWFDSPWLYVECYLYRRIKEAFEFSGPLRDYDSFRQQKEESFISSIPAAILLGTAVQEVTLQLTQSQESTLMFGDFMKFVEISLWGNKCDLSISGGSENYQSANPVSQVEILRKNILVNDIQVLWEVLCLVNKKRPEGVNMDLVLDNAGFELFTDLCLLEFLQAAKLVHKVRIYVKKMPWYVSDTLASDIDWMLNTMITHHEEILVTLGKHWSENIQSKIWTIEQESYWTLPNDYSEMKTIDPTLYSKLSESDIVIFKGDLNYRKLTSDRKWDPTTDFSASLRGFLPTSLCSLRTIKNDVITSFKPGMKEEMDKMSSNWLFTGQYAVIQCVPMTDLKL